MSIRVWDLIDVTPERAAQIRQWRIDDPDLSWRGTAGMATAQWTDQKDTNQLLGRDLCRAAAQLLGEDPNDEPWG